jgi:hypothetical protein
MDNVLLLRKANMNRTEIINIIARKIKAKRYLEIGVDNGINFNNVNCEYKVGVDPNPKISNIIAKTSDEFFLHNTESFDLIFIDGLHIYDQVYRDITNSLAVLSSNGYIICHDTNPTSEERQQVPWTGGDWNGDCWKAFVKLYSERTDLEMITIDTDEGISIIKKGKQETLTLDSELTYQELEKNRKKWLNLKSKSEFRELISKENLIDLVTAFALNPNNSENNFNLALTYDEIGQTASAVSFYIRTAERTNDDLLKYECLIRAAMCFEKQGTRKFSVKGLLQHAIALQPKRPEGYYLLSVFYENEDETELDGKWFDSYMISSIGLEVADFEETTSLKTNIDYSRKEGLLFQKAHAAWWCGLCEESKNLFLKLYSSDNIDSNLKKIVYNNLVNMNAFETKVLTLYTKDKYQNFIMKFNGLEDIEINYSEAYQDLFALAVSNGKINGTYVEIGSGDPYHGNNTYLLEKQFNWRGVSLDINEDFVKSHNDQRNHTCLLKDATNVNYSALFESQGFEEIIDYLQIDCDPPAVSFTVLLSIPFEKYKFRAITFEHDHYAEPTSKYREKARKYLESYGYVVFATDISPDDHRPYEDWFVHPDLFDISKIKNYYGTKNAEKFMLGNNNE